MLMPLCCVGGLDAAEPGALQSDAKLAHTADRSGGADSADVDGPDALKLDLMAEEDDDDAGSGTVGSKPANVPKPKLKPKPKRRAAKGEMLCSGCGQHKKMELFGVSQAVVAHVKGTLTEYMASARALLVDRAAKGPQKDSTYA